jgi:hypothetical protein
MSFSLLIRFGTHPLESCPGKVSTSTHFACAPSPAAARASSSDPFSRARCPSPFQKLRPCSSRDSRHQGLRPVVRTSPWRKQSTTADTDDARTRVRVTHPFHPLFGREFELVTYRKTWGEDRVYFRDESGQVQRMPISWTNAAPPDPFRTIAAGRCRSRPGDLLRLAELIDRLRGDDV